MIKRIFLMTLLVFCFTAFCFAEADTPEPKQAIGELNNPYMISCEPCDGTGVMVFEDRERQVCHFCGGAGEVDDGKLCILELESYPTIEQLTALKNNSYIDKHGREIPIDKITFYADYSEQKHLELIQNLDLVELMSSCDSLTECAETVDRLCEDHGGGQSSELSQYDDCQGRCVDGTEVIVVCG